MYVREYHSELIDPAEQRTTDLGYVAVVLTDTNPEEDEIRNFGDVFVEYVVDLMAPRVGLAASKCAFIHLEDQINAFTHPTEGTTAHQPLFHPDTDFPSREMIDPNSTIMFDITHEGGEGTDSETVYESSAGPENIAYSAITFKEPFTGIIHLTVDAASNTGPDPPRVMFNGGVNRTLKAGQQHPHRFCKFKPLKSLAKGVTNAVHTIKVVAQAGETLGLSQQHAMAEVGRVTQLIMTEASELLLDALPAILL
jgi:hypothetical protein